MTRGALGNDNLDITLSHTHKPVPRNPITVVLHPLSLLHVNSRSRRRSRSVCPSMRTAHLHPIWAAVLLQTSGIF